MCCTNNIDEGAALCLPPFFDKNALVATLNSRMSGAAHTNPVIASVSTTELLIQRTPLRSYLEVVDYFLKTFANDQAIAEKDSRILRYIQSAHMTPTSYADNLYAKTCRIADVYNESFLNDTYIEGVDPSICHSIRE